MNYFKSLILYPTEELTPPEIELYPNPIEDIINVRSDLVDFTDYEIFDERCRFMVGGKIVIGHIKEDDLPFGKYILRLLNEKESHITRFLKQ